MRTVISRAHPWLRARRRRPTPQRQLENVDAETAADPPLRAFSGAARGGRRPTRCCLPKRLAAAEGSADGSERPKAGGGRFGEGPRSVRTPSKRLRRIRIAQTLQHLAGVGSLSVLAFSSSSEAEVTPVKDLPVELSNVVSSDMWRACSTSTSERQAGASSIDDAVVPNRRLAQPALGDHAPRAPVGSVARRVQRVRYDGLELCVRDPARSFGAWLIQLPVEAAPDETRVPLTTGLHRHTAARRCGWGLYPSDGGLVPVVVPVEERKTVKASEARRNQKAP
jgi:hypothetical protein